MRFYSQTTGSTYLSEIHSVMPDDVVRITEDRFLSVIANPAPDMVREHDIEGLPILIPFQQSAGVVHQRKTAELNAACEAAITGGFWSSALGQPHQYTSQMDDQLNLTGVILAGQDSLYACRDQAGAKAFRPHTTEQLRQVGNDFNTVKQQFLQKADRLKQLLDQALAAADITALEAVTWEGAQ